MTDPQHSKALSDLKGMLEISRAMAATHDLEELLGLIVRHSLTLLDVERGTLFLYDEANRELVANIATGMEQLRVPAEKGICGETVRTGRTVLVPDAYADPRFNPEIDKATGFRTRNIMSVPLSDYEGQLVGVLQLLNHRDGDFSEYDVDLAEMLGAQAGVVLQRARLMEHYIQKKEMQRAMEIARGIQRSRLPSQSPRIDGFDVAGLSEPADETGGDTYDFIPLSDGQWAFAVADATGHGVGPALVVAETRAMLRASAHLSEPTTDRLSHILRTVNHLLCQDLSGGSFVTCFLAILDPAASELTWASAGHGPICLYRRAEDAFTPCNATSVPLGVLDDVDFDETRQFTFQSGDLLAVTTDGVFEATPPNSKEMFGVDRMLASFRRTADQPAKRMIDILWNEVQAYTAPRPQEDDVTAMLLKRR